MQALRMPTYVRDQIRFCIEKRVGALEQGYRQNIGLVGREGLGKTFALCSLVTTLTGRARFIPVYVHAKSLDFESLVDRWIGSMLSGVFLSQSIQPPSSLSSLMTAADPIVPKTMERVRQVKKLLRREKYTACARELFALTNSLTEETGKKVILMIDEFHELEKVPVPDPFAVLGREIMVGKDTLYLVTSSCPLRAHAFFDNQLSLLFGNFEVIDLAPFGFEETIQYLRNKFPHRLFSPGQLRFLIRMSDGSPQYLDFITRELESCLISHNAFHRLLNESDSQVIPDTCVVEAFERQLYTPHGALALLFEKRLESCRALGKNGATCIKALVAISEGRNKPLSIAAYINKKTHETKKILQRLIQQGLIAKKGSFYLIEDPLFRFWIREVFGPKQHIYLTKSTEALMKFREALRHQLRISQGYEVENMIGCVETLFKEFRHDVIEMDGKRLSCPQFNEIIVRPSRGRTLPLLARSGNIRWLCHMAIEKVREEDVALLLDESKRFRKKLQRKVLVALKGIDQNAKLLAQEAKVLIWNLRQFNSLLDIYNLPKLVLLPDQFEYGTALGAVAQSIHTAEGA